MRCGWHTGCIDLLEPIEIGEDVAELSSEQLRLGLGQIEVRQRRYPLDVCSFQGCHA